MSLTPAALAAFWRNELGFYELVVAKKGKRNGYGEVGIKVRIWKLALQAKHGVRQLAGWSGGLQDASKPERSAGQLCTIFPSSTYPAQELEQPNAPDTDRPLQLFHSEQRWICLANSLMGKRPRGRSPVKLNSPSIHSHSLNMEDAGSLPVHLLLII